MFRWLSVLVPSSVSGHMLNQNWIVFENNSSMKYNICCLSIQSTLIIISHFVFHFNINLHLFLTSPYTGFHGQNQSRQNQTDTHKVKGCYVGVRHVTEVPYKEDNTFLDKRPMGHIAQTINRIFFIDNSKIRDVCLPLLKYQQFIPISWSRYISNLLKAHNASVWHVKLILNV